MKKIGRYTITGLLGKGGMGRVFKVTYPVTGRVAALKLLDPSPLLTELTAPKELKEQFTREAVIMASIRHPHVVDVLDFCQTDGQLYYLMDFFCNSLGTLMGESGEAEQARVIPVQKAVHYAVQTLKGLSCLHFFGIIHRDIKPANILVTDLDVAKICDFGLSRHRGENREYRHGGIRVGSPFYAAPEQEKDPDQVDATADLYATGTMLYKMLTGILPKKNRPAASALNPDLDEDWDLFFARAMNPERSRRFQGADLMRRNLEALLVSWEKKKEKICTLPDFFETENSLETDVPLPEQQQPVVVRSEPRKIPFKQARAFFGLDRFMQPREYLANIFLMSGNDIVTDRQTGLVWQQCGTGFPVTWHQAEMVVDQLNGQAFGGLTGWRLPTLHELLTLAVPPARGRDHCISPVFDMSQKCLWSADKCTFVSAWYMSLEMGFAARNDLTAFYHVKAVCSGGLIPGFP
ncbi:MAG: protein kinase [Desulfotignum sp.]